MHEMNGHPYPMPSSPHIGPHGNESRLGALEATCGVIHRNQGELFRLQRELDRRVTSIEAKALSNLSSANSRLAAAGQFMKDATPFLRELSWPLLFLLAGLGMISLDRIPLPHISVSGPGLRE